MSEINNFITDLLDEMVLLGHKELFLNSDQEPKYADEYGSYVDAHSFSELVEEEELIEDMQALGFVSNTAFYYLHLTEANEEIILAAAFRTDMDTAIVNFRKMEDPSPLLQGMLAKATPLPAEEYNKVIMQKLKNQTRNINRAKAGSR